MIYMDDGMEIPPDDDAISESSSNSSYPQKKQYITNQYSSINEPLDVIMGGSGAMLNIVHTLVNSLSRLDGAVEVIFNRLDDLDSSVATLTYNIQGFEHEVEKPKNSAAEYGFQSGVNIFPGAPPPNPRSSQGSEYGSRPNSGSRPTTSNSKEQKSPKKRKTKVDSGGHELAPIHSHSKHTHSHSKNKTPPKTPPGTKTPPNAQTPPSARVKTPPTERPDASHAPPTSSFDGPHFKQVITQNPDGAGRTTISAAAATVGQEELEELAARYVQQVYRGHRERGFNAMLTRMRFTDMAQRKVPKTMSVACRLERLEEQSSNLKKENRSLKKFIEQVRQDAKDAIRMAEEKADEALVGVARLDNEMVEFKDHVEENFIEQGQRIDTVNNNLNAFQDEVATGFKEQGASIDKLVKSVDWLQSAEGQQALKDILIEREMGGVLDLVREVQNVLKTAGTLPRQDSSVVKKLMVVQEVSADILEKARKVEEEMMEEDAAADDDSWLSALNEPNFMNDLMELLWSIHTTIRENEENIESIENGTGGPDVFVLDKIKVYVSSLVELLGDTGTSICGVMEHFLNKGRQQLSIRELVASLRSIKSDVLRDVTSAVQDTLDKKADETDFRALGKRTEAGLTELVRMKPDVELWSNNKDRLIGLDLETFNLMEGRIDENSTSVFTLGQKLGGLVSHEDMEQMLEGLQAQFNQLEEKNDAGAAEFEKMLEPKADRTELAKLARAFASKNGADDPILAFYTDKPKFHCLSCNRPLPAIPNSTDSAPKPLPAPEVFDGSSKDPSLLMPPSYDKPLAKVKPPPKQRALMPGEEHKYSLDLAVPPETGLKSSSLDSPLEEGTGVSRYQRNIPTKPSRLSSSAGGGVNFHHPNP